MKTRHLLAPLSILAGIIVAGCGTSEKTPEAELAGVRQAVPANRFTEQQIREVYSDATEVRSDGRTWPVSKPPVSAAFTYADAPDAFKREWGTFTAGGEMRGYMNLGFVPSSGFQSRLIRNFEAVSTWKTILDPSGSPVFANAVTVDANGNRTADAIDGNAPATGEIHHVRLTIAVSGFNVDILGDAEIRNNAGEIQLAFTNTRDVRAPIVGTIIKSGGMKVLLSFWPYNKGWLSYGASAVKMERYEDRFEPKVAEGFVTGFFNWLKTNTVIYIR